MLRGVLCILIGLILGTLAIFPMVMSAVGHDSRSIFVYLAHSTLLDWPFAVARSIAPASAAESLGLALHYTFYIFIAWLLLSFFFRPKR